MAWEAKQVDDVCFVEYGTRVVKKRDGGTIYPVYGGGGATFFMDESNREDCLIISRFAMSEKCTRFVKGKFFLNDSGLSIISKNENELCQEFLNYQILSLNDYIYSLARGTAQKNLNVPKFRKMDIHFPKSIDEQKRIVAILDEAFESIAKAKENAEMNLKNAKEIFENCLQNVFETKGDGWDEKTLKEISDIFGRGRSMNRPRNDPKLYGGKYPFIQTGDIRNSNHHIGEYTQTYNEIGLAQSKLWLKGTICITIAANIAETGVLSFDACFPDSVIGLVVNQKIANNNFVEYMLQSFKKRLQAKGKGSAQDNLNMKKFENEYFPIPTLIEQQAIVQKLDALSAKTKKLEKIYIQKLVDLEELKNSILAKAFNGELTEASA
jgi:type I restriction enzyme S subunit